MAVTESNTAATVSTKVASLLVTTLIKYMSFEIVTNPYAFQLAFPIILVMVIDGLISTWLVKKLISKYVK